MSLQSVKEDILKKGMEKAEQIKKDGLREKEEILKLANEKIAELKKRKEQEIKSYEEKTKKQEISSAELEVKRTKLIMQKELLDLAFEKTKEKLAMFSKEENEKLLKAIITKHENEGKRIYFAKKDEEIIKKLSKLKYAGNINCIGGIMIESEDGTIRNDYTFDTLLKEIYDKKLKEVHAILFK